MLETSVAALAGLSVAFLALAAPADRLADLAGGLGLSAILPAARIVAGVAGAGITFASTFLLLRWLDRFGRPSEQPELLLDPPLAVAAEPPRRRRDDLRTDALEPAAVAAGPPPTGSNIPDLMERLEQGLSRLRSRACEAPRFDSPPAPEAADDRLQSAIDGLRRLASGRS